MKFLRKNAVPRRSPTFDISNKTITVGEKVKVD